MRATWASCDGPRARGAGAGLSFCRAHPRRPGRPAADAKPNQPPLCHPRLAAATASEGSGKPHGRPRIRLVTLGEKLPNFTSEAPRATKLRGKAAVFFRGAPSSLSDSRLPGRTRHVSPARRPSKLPRPQRPPGSREARWRVGARAVGARAASPAGPPAPRPAAPRGAVGRPGLQRPPASGRGRGPVLPSPGPGPGPARVALTYLCTSVRTRLQHSMAPPAAPARSAPPGPATRAHGPGPECGSTPRPGHGLGAPGGAGGGRGPSALMPGPARGGRRGGGGSARWPPGGRSPRAGAGAAGRPAGSAGRAAALLLRAPPLRRRARSALLCPPRGLGPPPLSARPPAARSRRARHGRV